MYLADRAGSSAHRLFVCVRDPGCLRCVTLCLVAVLISACGYTLGAVSSRSTSSLCIKAGSVSGSNQRAARELRLRTALLQHLTAQTCTGTEVNVRVQSLNASRRVSSYDSNLLPVFYRWQLRVVWQVGSKVAGRTLISRVDTDVPYLTDGRKNEELETVFLERLVGKAVRDLSWQMISLEHEYAADLT